MCELHLDLRTRELGGYVLSKQTSLAATFLILVVTLSFLFPVYASDNEDAVSAISEAEQSISQAYESMLIARSVGANTSALLVELNRAAELLSEARMASGAGNLEEAKHYADLAVAAGNGVSGEAEQLRAASSPKSASEYNANLMLAAVSRVLAVSLALFALLVGYRYFKKLYFRRLLKMKPKVAEE